MPNTTVNTKYDNGGSSDGRARPSTRFLGFYGCQGKVVHVEWLGTSKRKVKPATARLFDCPSCNINHQVSVYWRTPTGETDPMNRKKPDIVILEKDDQDTRRFITPDSKDPPF